MKLPNQVKPVSRNLIGLNHRRVVANVIPSDTCISVGVINGRVCLSVPVIGKVCIPISTPLPSGTAASACISVCKKWGIPTGACVTVTALGHQVARECFGAC